jgi:hypothetical protein
MEHLIRGERFGSGNNFGAHVRVYVAVKSSGDMAYKILCKRFVGLGGEAAERELHEISRRKIGFANGIPQ